MDTADVTRSELLRPDGLQTRLNALLPRAISPATCVGLYSEGEYRFAATGLTPEKPRASELLVNIGCATKLFVGSVLGRMFAGGSLHPNTPVAECLDRNAHTLEQLKQITLEELLNHTHGLDDSAIHGAPIDERGFIDVQQLCRRLGTARLAEPGQHYSYSRVGAWLLAALLERRYGAPIPTVLEQALLRPLDIARHSSMPRELAAVDSFFCAASGGNFALTLQDALDFLRRHLTGTEPYWLASADSYILRAGSVSVPGWSPLETGVRMGWKEYGSSWLGHNSVLPGAAAILRLSPELRTAFIVLSSDRSPASIALSLFGKAFPGFARLQMPRLLSQTESRQLDVAPYLGTYANDASIVSVKTDAPGTLELRLQPRRATWPQTTASLAATLRPAEENTFFLQPPAPARLPYVQFIGQTEHGFSRVWDGTSLRPRAE